MSAVFPMNRVQDVLRRMDDNSTQSEAMKTCFGILAIMSREDVNKLLIARDGMEVQTHTRTHIAQRIQHESGDTAYTQPVAKHAYLHTHTLQDTKHFYTYTHTDTHGYTHTHTHTHTSYHPTPYHNSPTSRQPFSSPPHNTNKQFKK